MFSDWADDRGFIEPNEPEGSDHSKAAPIAAEPDTYAVLVQCEDEPRQVALLNELAQKALIAARWSRNR